MHVYVTINTKENDWDEEFWGIESLDDLVKFLKEKYSNWTSFVFVF